MVHKRTLIVKISLLCLAILCVPPSTSAEGRQNLEECTPSSFENVTYSFKVWVLSPFSSQYKFALERIKPTLEMAYDTALQTLSNTYPDSVLSMLQQNLQFELLYNDSKCSADVAMTTVSDIREAFVSDEQCSSEASSQLINIFFGGTCDYLSGRVASLASHWDWLFVSPGTRASALDVKNGTDCCSTLIRPGITQTETGKFARKFFQKYNWDNIEVVYTRFNSHGAFVDAGTSTDCSTQINGVTQNFRIEPKIEYFLVGEQTDAALENSLDEVLQRYKSRSRVSIWCIGRRAMRKVMVRAEQLGMTGGDFAFVYMDLYNTNTSYNWTDADDHVEYGTGNPDNTSRNTQFTNQYLRALTVVTMKSPSTSQQFFNTSKAIKEKISSSTDGRVVEYDEYINPFLISHYDGLIMIISELVKSFCDGSEAFTNGELFARRFWGSTFDSLGRNITISEKGDAVLNFSVMDMEPSTKTFEVSSNYYGNTRTFEDLKPVDWPGSTKPITEPDCGYNNEKCEKADNALYYILGACTAVLLLACLAITVLYRKMKKEKKLRMKMWRVKWDDIDWSRKRKTSTTLSKDSSHSITSSSAGLHQMADKQIFTKTGMYRGNMVAVKEMKRRTVSVDRSLLLELEELYAMEHDHICKFIGAIDEAPHVSIISEYCPRGSLQDLLEDDSEYEMEDVFKNSLICDVIKGMAYLHRSFFQFHGNLKSSNCLVDSRFVVKLTDFGLKKFREGARGDSVLGHKFYENKLWTAPELLRSTYVPGTQKGDVYSFAIIVQEIIYRKGVFYMEEKMTPKEILTVLVSPSSTDPPLRPTVFDNDDIVWDSNLKKLVRSCWSENPEQRPSFPEIQKVFRKTFKEKNLVDSLLHRLENYSMHLEEKVEERTEQYKGEKERADTLLYQMLPQAVAEQLKRGNNVLPQAYESVTIFFSDIVGFTAISHGSKPMEVVNMLNDLYTMFDQIIDQFQVYKVETIGDAYMVVSGLPEKNGNLHAREIARMSLSLIDCVTNKFKIRHMPNTQLKLRVGIHTGPVVAGVVGVKMPRYCLFGDTVNTASRMESNGKAFAVHVSPKTKEILDDFDTFHLEQREDEVFLKGLGMWQTWWLTGEDVESSLENQEQREEKTLPASKPAVHIVTFEHETFAAKSATSKADQQSSLKAHHPRDLSPTNTNRSSPKVLRETSPHRIMAGKKRYRTGLVEGVGGLAVEKGKLNEVQNEKVAIVRDHSGTEVFTPKSLRKVRFDKEKAERNSINSLNNELHSGRDSGIEVAFDNPEFLALNSDDEIDEL